MANLCREAAYGPVREAGSSIQHIAASEVSLLSVGEGGVGDGGGGGGGGSHHLKAFFFFFFFFAYTSVYKSRI